MGEFDVPAFYSKVLSVTGASQLTLITHSQGSTQSFAALSEFPDLNEKTEHFIALAPVLFMSPLEERMNVFHFLDKINAISILHVLNVRSIQFIDIAANSYIRWVIKGFCVYTSFYCKMIVKLFTDWEPDYLNFDKMPEYLSINPSGTSTQCLEHYLQFLELDAPIFQKFDYGPEKNIQKYGTETPTVYDISKITTKVSIFYGENDNLCSLENTAFIMDQKKDIESYFLGKWGHLGYIWAKDKSSFLKSLDLALES